jgi:hypothetical protein
VWLAVRIRLSVVRAQLFTRPTADQEHDEEVDVERDCYLDHIQRESHDQHDQIALEGNMTRIVNSSATRGQMADARNKAGLVPLLSLARRKIR